MYTVRRRHCCYVSALHPESSTCAHTFKWARTDEKKRMKRNWKGKLIFSFPCDKLLLYCRVVVIHRTKWTFPAVADVDWSGTMESRAVDGAESKVDGLNFMPILARKEERMRKMKKVWKYFLLIFLFCLSPFRVVWIVMRFHRLFSSFAHAYSNMLSAAAIII